MPIAELSDRALRGGPPALSAPPPRVTAAPMGAASAYVNISEMARRALVDSRAEASIARAAAPSLVANGPVTNELLARLALSRATAGAASLTDAPIGTRRAPPPQRDPGDERAQSVGPTPYEDLRPMLLPPSPDGVDPVVAFAQLAARAGYYVLRFAAPDPDAWRDAESPVRLAYAQYDREPPRRGSRVSVYA